MILRDTIVALATPHGRGGIGVVRLSGPQSREIANRLLRFRSQEQSGCNWISWRCHWADLLDANGQIVDEVVAAFFESPRSYTGEDVIEISCHGAPVVLQLCVERALDAGARLAEPGEFTFRAYLNSRIDLPQAEAVRDLIDATTLYQARVAAQQLHGSVSRRIQPLKEQLLELIALMEAGIDFAEDDVSVASPDELHRRLRPLQGGLSALLQTFRTGRLVHSGFTLAIAGRPNVGKSSLFNRLLEQDRAIVTDIPGTTRDLVSESTTLAGIPVRLLDTAGIRQGQDLVETLGIERSYSAMADADLTLLVFDGTSGWTEADAQLLEGLESRSPILVRNKVDVAPANTETDGSVQALGVSALTGQGIASLQDAILLKLAPNGLYAPESGSLTNLRQASLLRESKDALDNAGRAIDFGIPHEMILLDLYAALRPIDAVTGATTADDILNRIFSTFCIGK